jgi:hypothetical protein
MKAKAAFYPWKDIVGKKVSKLRSIAELGRFTVCTEMPDANAGGISLDDADAQL